MNIECYFCHQKTVQKLLEKFNPAPDVAQKFVFTIHELLGNKKEIINPELACYIHRQAREILGSNDLYAEEKKAANQLLLSHYKYWRSVIDMSENPFATAAKLAVVGNIIDYGAHSVSGDITKQINKLLKHDLSVDKTAALGESLKKAKSVLYLGDNAGEIFFDRLFIETINHPNLTYVTRGFPVLNDITKEDAVTMGIDKLCHVIDNGSDAPSTLLKFCSPEFLKAYHSADLIISKGQGNFEGLMDEGHPNTYFMLIAKCHTIAQMIGTKKNAMIVTQLKNK